MQLPPLREELALHAGPVLADGQPSHTLHDPVRNLFFQLDWPALEVLRRWHLGESQAVAAAVSRETALQMDADDVAGVLAFFQHNQLLQAVPGHAARYAQRLRQRRGSIWHRLLHHYLFFRIPVWRPDAWLARWAPRLDFFYSRLFLWLTLGALGAGLLAAGRQWERFGATLVDTFSWQGFAGYGFALLAVKLLHELGHAFTAKRFGCRVPTMGIAFMVLWPVAYTDTNEVWKLRERHQRLAVAAAGVLTELAVAAWATLAWALLPDGGLKNMAFVLATVTWIASVAINSSPFMRFDGYFLLADWLGMPNLHERAFALARWHLRERLFGLGQPVPESMSAPRRHGLILFAWATWLYRLAVFTAIAAMVYAFFIKAVGIALFAVEIGWFVLAPLWRELRAWQELWPKLQRQRRLRSFVSLFALLVLALAMPWPSRPSASAMLRPAQQFIVYAPPHAQVAALPLREGQQVRAGTPLMVLALPELESRQAAAAGRLQRARWQASAGAFDQEQRSHWQAAQEEVAAAEAEVAMLEAEAARYRPLAPYDGVLRDLSPELRPGLWLGRQEVLARLVSTAGQQAVGYLDEEAVALIAVGDTAMFYADAADGPVLRLRVAAIDRDASRVLPEAELSSLHGGAVAVREKNGQLFPERPVYRVTLEALEGDAASRSHAWRGKVVVAGGWTVPAWRYMRAAAALFWREAGF
ncbi:site-2 protease family protein [Massilia sp. erpn]|uniref:site-2 protease family protein n=1 Tax=Massilia sp. erpn TaxID=2738142 RepID=UPI002103189C|nr:site-2 protease family protein [Massilia sp. erpn]UTY57618.1 HlyD family efflux transporter periplasmic adaptor subunit [Massilia sp. erpn]